jgi:hypothetical protein
MKMIVVADRSLTIRDRQRGGRSLCMPMPDAVNSADARDFAKLT